MLVLALLVCTPFRAGSAPVPASFLYFNPDSIQNNFSGLKETMDAFLAASGFPFSF